MMLFCVLSFGYAYGWMEARMMQVMILGILSSTEILICHCVKMFHSKKHNLFVMMTDYAHDGCLPQYMAVTYLS